MKMIIFGGLALAFAVPAAAQVAPAAGTQLGHPQHQAADPKGGQQHQDHAKHMAEMHKHCQEMMKHHGKDHGAKPDPAAASHASHQGN